MILIIRIIGREKHRIRMDHLLIHIVTAVERACVIREVSCQADGQLGCLRDIDVHVGTERIGLLVDVVIERIALIHLQDTRILGKTACHIVPRHLSTAPGRNVRTVSRGEILEQHLVPVV